VIEYLLKANNLQLSADTFLKRINRVKLITLTDKDDKVISHKVTKKIDDETKTALTAFAIKAIRVDDS